MEARSRRFANDCSAASTTRPESAPLARYSPAVASPSLVTVAVDAGTTGVRALVVDQASPGRRPGLCRAGHPLPPARMGRTGSGRDLAQGPCHPRRGRRATERPQPGGWGHRHHQPARNGRRLGPAHRTAVPPRHRLAGSQNGRNLRPDDGRRPPPTGPGADRPGPRPLLLGHQDAVAARARRPFDGRPDGRRSGAGHRRLVGVVEPDRRGRWWSVRHRRQQRRPNPAVRHRGPAVVGGTRGALRCPAVGPRPRSVRAADDSASSPPPSLEPIPPCPGCRSAAWPATNTPPCSGSAASTRE